MGGIAPSIAPLHEEAAGKMESSKRDINSVQIKRMAGIITEAARKLTSERKVRCISEGILAVLLINMGYDEDRALHAVSNYKSIRSALVFLKSAVFIDCAVCGVSTPENELSQNKLEPCGHSACTNCLKNHFFRQAYHGKLTCTECPTEIQQCANVDLLQRIFREDYGTLDDRLFRRTLEQDEEIKYCANKKCGMSYIVPRELSKMQCTACRTLACAKCGSEWRKEHENRTCEEFKKWKSENDPDDPEFKSQDLIRKTAIMCPKCNTPFFKALGGCAHFTCGNCKREFCECCKTEFWKGAACGNEACKDKGMHGHHPRNCFFYTRDYEWAELGKLLKDAGVAVDETAPQDATATCAVGVSSDDYVDSPCGVKILKAGKCEKHYKEMLCDLIYRHRVDVLNAMTTDKLVNELQKHSKDVPQLSSELGPEERLVRLREIVAKAVPLPA